MASLRWIFGGLLILALAVVVAPAQASTAGAGLRHNCDTYRGQRFHSLYRQRDRQRHCTCRQWGPAVIGARLTTLIVTTTDQYLYVLVWNDLGSTERRAIPRPGWDNSPYPDTRLSIPTSPSGSTSTALAATLPVTVNPLNLCADLTTVQKLINDGGDGSPRAKRLRPCRHPQWGSPSNSVDDPIYDPWYYVQQLQWTNKRHQYRRRLDLV